MKLKKVEKQDKEENTKRLPYYGKMPTKNESFYEYKVNYNLPAAISTCKYTIRYIYNNIKINKNSDYTRTGRLSELCWQKCNLKIFKIFFCTQLFILPNYTTIYYIWLLLLVVYCSFCLFQC